MTLLEKAKRMFPQTIGGWDVYKVGPKWVAFGSWGNICRVCKEKILKGEELRTVYTRIPGTLWAGKSGYPVHVRHFGEAD